VASAVSRDWKDLIISEFRDEHGRDYVLVVNNCLPDKQAGLTDSTQAELVVRGKRPRLVRVGWEAKETPIAAKGGPYWRYVENAETVRICIWLAPGQMELYRVEPAAPQP